MIAGMKHGESCANCAYYKELDKPQESFYSPINEWRGECCRYPQRRMIGDPSTYTCGEWRFPQ